MKETMIVTLLVGVPIALGVAALIMEKRSKKVQHEKQVEHCCHECCGCMCCVEEKCGCCECVGECTCNCSCGQHD